MSKITRILLAIFCACAAGFAPVHADDQKISAMNNGGYVQNSDLFHVDRSGADYAAHVGTMGSQDASAVNITGGTIAGTGVSTNSLFTVNLNTLGLPSPQTGSVIQFANVNGTPTRIECDTFGSSCYYSSIAYGGTNGSRTALASGTEIGGYNAWGYNGSALVGPRAAFRTYAAQNWTTGANGTYADVAVTPDGATAQAESVRFENDGGVTVPSTVTGGDKGAGTINAAGFYVNGGAIPLTMGGSGATTAVGALNNFYGNSSTALNTINFLRSYDTTTSTSSYVAQNTYGIYLDPALIPNIAAGIARVVSNTTGGPLNNNRALIVCSGDSTTIGANASGVSNRPNECAYIASALTAKGIPAYLDGFFGGGPTSGNGSRASVDTRVVLNSWTATSSQATLGGAIYQSSSSGTPFTFTQPNPVDTCVAIYFDYGQSGATATLQAGSGSTVNLSEANTSGIHIVTATTTLGVNACKVNFTGSATFYLEGMYAYDSSQAAVDIIDAGYWGAVVGNWDGTGSNYSAANAIKYLQADGVLFKTNINDANSTSQQTYITGMETTISTGMSNGVTDFVMETDNPANGVTNQPAFVSLQYDIAQTENVPLIDSYSIIGSYAKANAEGLMSDSYHMKTGGYAKQGQTVTNFFLSAFQSGGSQAAAAPYIFNLGGTEVGRFTTAGNFGIDTPIPASALDVYGAIDISGLNGLSRPDATSLLGGPTGGTSLTGVHNTGFGDLALNSATTGTDNTAIGYDSLASVTTGAHNTAVGSTALAAVTTGANNTALGYQVGSTTLTTGADDILIGVDSTTTTYSATTSTAVGIGQGVLPGTDDVGIGYQALNATAGDAQKNTAVGWESLQKNTTGVQNVAVGGTALNLNTTGADNVAVGYGALAVSTTAASNTAVGWDSLVADTTGTANVAVGQRAGLANLTGSNNIFIGYKAGATNAGTGSNNVLIGPGPGGSGCDVISSNAGNEFDLCGAGGSTYVMHVTGTGTVGTETGVLNGLWTMTTTGSSYPLTLTNSAGTCTHTPGSGSESVSCSSDKKFKQNIEDASWFSGWLWDFHIRQYNLIADGSHVDAGVVAQELKVTHPEMVHTNKQYKQVCTDEVGEDGVNRPRCQQIEDGTYLSVDEPNPWRLIKAIQELQAFAAIAFLFAFGSVLYHIYHHYRYHGRNKKDDF